MTDVAVTQLCQHKGPFTQGTWLRSPMKVCDFPPQGCTDVAWIPVAAVHSSLLGHVAVQREPLCPWMPIGWVLGLARTCMSYWDTVALSMPLRVPIDFYGQPIHARKTLTCMRNTVKLHMRKDPKRCGISARSSTFLEKRLFKKNRSCKKNINLLLTPPSFPK